MPEAIIFDCNSSRRKGIKQAFNNAGWDAGDYTEVYPDKNTKEKHYKIPNGISLILLHQADSTLHFGNKRSSKFLKNTITAYLKNNSAVIGYSGASPDNYESHEFYKNNTQAHLLLELNGADGADFEAFARTWAEDLSKPPPFELLRPDFPGKEIANYLKSICDDVTEVSSQDIEIIDSYFGFKSPKIIQATEFGLMAMSLRAKVSHSWLDHEVLSVTDEQLETRDGKQWKEIKTRWKTLYKLALEFSNTLGELTATSLVDQIEELKSLPDDSKTKLKLELERLQSDSLANKKAQYEEKLGEFWTSAQQFLDKAIKENSDYLAEWKDVKDNAETLKQLFRDGVIPDGIEVP